MRYTSTTAIRVRALTNDERTAVERLAHSRVAPARQVERAQVVCLASQRRAVAGIAECLRLNPQTVRDWLKRFNAEGLGDWHHSGELPNDNFPADRSAAVRHMNCESTPCI